MHTLEIIRYEKNPESLDGRGPLPRSRRLWFPERCARTEGQ